MENLQKAITELVANQQLSSDMFNEFLDLRKSNDLLEEKSEKQAKYIEEQATTIAELNKNNSELLKIKKDIEMREQELLRKEKEYDIMVLNDEKDLLIQQISMKEEKSTALFDLVSILFKNTSVRKSIIWNTWIQNIDKDQYGQLAFSSDYRNIWEETIIE